MSFPANEYLPASRRVSPLAPVLMGIAFAAVALAGQTRVGAWLRGFLAPRPREAARPLLRIDSDQPLQSLRERILGRRKAAVVSLCGRPRTAAFATAGHCVTTDLAFWRADTWYYALDWATQTAMAIRFVNGVATDVDFFGGPEA